MREVIKIDASILRKSGALVQLMCTDDEYPIIIEKIQGNIHSSYQGLNNKFYLSVNIEDFESLSQRQKLYNLEVIIDNLNRIIKQHVNEEIYVIESKDNLIKFYEGNVTTYQNEPVLALTSPPKNQASKLTLEEKCILIFDLLKSKDLSLIDPEDTKKSIYKMMVVLKSIHNDFELSKPYIEQNFLAADRDYNETRMNREYLSIPCNPINLAARSLSSLLKQYPDLLKLIDIAPIALLKNVLDNDYQLFFDTHTEKHFVFYENKFKIFNPDIDIPYKAIEAKFIDDGFTTKDLSKAPWLEPVEKHHFVDKIINDSNLKWDGVDRFHDICSILPIAEVDRVLHDIAFKRWYVGMVKQFFNTTCDFNNLNSLMLIYISKQGIGKTTFCENLLPTEFKNFYKLDITLTKFNCDNVKQTNILDRKMLATFDEVEFTANNLNWFKSRISAARTSVANLFAEQKEVQNTVSCIGTTNDPTPLVEDSENRRFAVFQLEKRLIRGLEKIDKMQLFLQAKYLAENHWIDYQYNQDFALSITERAKKFTDDSLESTYLNDWFQKDEANLMKITDMYQIISRKLKSNFDKKKIKKLVQQRFETKKIDNTEYYLVQEKDLSQKLKGKDEISWK